MADELRLKLERKRVDVILEDANDEEKKYTLVELTGKERNKYLNKMIDRVKIGKDGSAAGIKNFDGFQADLLKASLYNEDETLVTVDEIESLPASIQQALFDRAQKLSGLDNNPEDNEEKNV